jgi:prevent-host-death family protein
MGKPVNVHDAKSGLSRLLERAHAGEEIIIAKNGVPYARLVPLSAPQARKPGQLANPEFDDTRFDEPLPPEELQAWEGLDE